MVLDLEIITILADTGIFGVFASGAFCEVQVEFLDNGLGIGPYLDLTDGGNFVVRIEGMQPSQQTCKRPLQNGITTAITKRGVT